MGILRCYDFRVLSEPAPTLELLLECLVRRDHSHNPFGSGKGWQCLRKISVFLSLQLFNTSPTTSYLLHAGAWFPCFWLPAACISFSSLDCSHPTFILFHPVWLQVCTNGRPVPALACLQRGATTCASLILANSCK